MTDGAGLNVSRETLQKLKHFAALVEKWTPRINLISKASIPHIWDRHILDSVQLFDLAPSSGHWVDIGSGGGFPGIVAAALSAGGGGNHKFTFVESDQRKCAFLRTAARELELNVVVLSQRIESIDPLRADILSARALTDLSGLLAYCERHLACDGTALFPKGENWQKEQEQASEIWSYACEAITSKTNTAAAVLKIREISHV